MRGHLSDCPNATASSRKSSFREVIKVDMRHKCNWLGHSSSGWNPAELDQAINDHTVMLFFLNRHEPMGQILRGEWLRVGKDRGIPTFLDAAADVPPVTHLARYVHEGFDLVAISGGKALRGPQATGLLLGRADLVTAARKAISPHEGIGRGMKVGKEEMIGLLTAVERYLKLDHDAERQLWDNRAAYLMAHLAAIPGIRVEHDLPEMANHVPHVVVKWDASYSLLTGEGVCRCLLDGNPPIALLVEGERAVRIAVWTLQGDEHEHVAERLHALFA